MVRSNRNVCWLMMDLYGAYFRFRMLQIDQLHSHNMTYKFLIENRPLWQPLILHGTVFLSSCTRVEFMPRRHALKLFPPYRENGAPLFNFTLIGRDQGISECF